MIATTATTAARFAARFENAMKAARKAARNASDLAIAAEFGEATEAEAAAATAAATATAEAAEAAEWKMRAAAVIAAAARNGNHVFECVDTRWNVTEAARVSPKLVFETHGKKAARRFMPRNASHNDCHAPRATVSSLAAWLRETA